MGSGITVGLPVTSAPRIFIIGDLNVDYRLHVEGGDVRGSRVPGGTAFNAGVAFAETGFRPLIVGAVGEDEHGDFIMRAVAEHGLDAKLIRSSGKTGSCVLISDRGISRRISDADVSANAIHPLLLIEILKDLQPAPNEFIFVATHMIVRRSITECDEFFAEITRMSNRTVVDLVPHDLGAKVDTKNLRAALRHPIFLLITELGTFRSIFPLIPGGSLEPTSADWAAAFDGLGVSAAVIRYGQFGIEFESFATAPDYRNSIVTQSSSPVGSLDDPQRHCYGDRLTARVVKGLL